MFGNQTRDFGPLNLNFSYPRVFFLYYVTKLF